MEKDLNEQPLDPISLGLIAFFLILLTYAGYLSYKSIDYDVLKRLEATPLILPTPAPEEQQPPAAAPTTKK